MTSGHAFQNPEIMKNIFDIFFISFSFNFDKTICYPFPFLSDRVGLDLEFG